MFEILGKREDKSPILTLRFAEKNSSSILCTVNLKSKLQQAVNMTIYPGQFVSKVPDLFPLCAIFG